MLLSVRSITNESGRYFKHTVFGLQCCYFPMPTLGVAHRVFDHWTNIFLGGVILHGTSVPIFYEHSDDGEEIFVGEHPRMNLVAWGEG